MNVKIKLLFKHKVIIVIVTIVILAFSAIIFTSVRSLKLEKEHLAILENSKNIDIEISHSRIYLDDYYTIFDTLIREKIINSFKKTDDYISTLSSFQYEINGKYKENKRENLMLNISKIGLQVEQIKSMVESGFDEDLKFIDNAILIEYNKFQNIYLNFENSLHQYIVDDNLNFRRKGFILLIFIFGILVLSLFVIFRLINAFHAMEKQQANKTLEIEFKERKRIAADLHDGLGSILSSIVLYIKIIEKDCTKEIKNNNLLKVKELSTLALDNLEAVLNNLNPSILNRYGLIKALEIICDKINETGEVFCKLETSNLPGAFDKNLEINVYRIANELINNTLKHSGASKLYLNFEYEKNTLFFKYSDNGNGFNPDLILAYNDEKMGLLNIINRIESLGGKYKINSSPGNGVEFILRFNVTNK